MIAHTSQENQIADLVGPVAKAMGLELVRVRMLGGDCTTLQIMAERPDGTMDVDACADLSTEVSAILDVEDPIDSEYCLEVSSPGIDRPLTRKKDFLTWMGHAARLDMLRPVGSRKRFTGTLVGIEDDTVNLVSRDGTKAAIPFEDIRTAKLLLTDELISEAEARSKAAGAGSGPETED